MANSNQIMESWQLNIIERIGGKFQYNNEGQHPVWDIAATPKNKGKYYNSCVKILMWVC